MNNFNEFLGMHEFSYSYEQHMAMEPLLPTFGPQPQTLSEVQRIGRAQGANLQQLLHEDWPYQGNVTFDAPEVPEPQVPQGFRPSPQFQDDTGTRVQGGFDMSGAWQNVNHLSQAFESSTCDPIPAAQEHFPGDYKVAGQYYQMPGPAQLPFFPAPAPTAPEHYAGEYDVVGPYYRTVIPAQLPFPLAPAPTPAPPAAPVEQPQKRGPGRPRKHPPPDPTIPKRKPGRPKGARDGYKRLAKGEKATLNKEEYRAETAARQIERAATQGSEPQRSSSSDSWESWPSHTTSPF